MRRDRRLDLLGEDLLAAGVDRDRVAAEQFDRAVREVARPVAGHRVPHPVDDRERARGLGRVALVAERDVAALRSQPISS